jgi:gluconate 2-dehydrogenase gamma chain
VPWEEGAADVPPEITGTDFKFFTNEERAFIEAAIERLIPGDPVGPGALESGVVIFLDRQLFGPYGHGDHFFLGGPWPKGTPQQGYQSRFSPAQLYRAAIAAIDKHVAARLGAASFAKLDASAQDGLLKALEKNDLPLEGGVDGKIFFDMLLQNTKEGYFSDPLYGGNKGMGAWKMIGFPGAHYDYLEWSADRSKRLCGGGRPNGRGYNLFNISNDTGGPARDCRVFAIIAVKQASDSRDSFCIKSAPGRRNLFGRVHGMSPRKRGRATAPFPPARQQCDGAAGESYRIDPRHTRWNSRGGKSEPIDTPQYAEFLMEAFRCGNCRCGHLYP